MAAMQGKDLYNPISFGKDLLAGSVVAAISKTVVVPTEHVKLLLQVQASSKQIEAEQQYKGMVDCFMRIPREQGRDAGLLPCPHTLPSLSLSNLVKTKAFRNTFEETAMEHPSWAAGIQRSTDTGGGGGFFSFWCGNLANVIRYFPMQALKFAFKDKYKQIFVSKVDKEKQFWKWFLANPASGRAAGATSMCVVYPLDLAQTCLAADIGKEADQYSAVLEFFLLLKNLPLHNYKLGSIKKCKVFIEKEKMKVLLSDSSRDLMTVLLKLQIHTDFLACTRVLGFQCRESLSTKRPILDVMTPLRDYCQIQNKQTPFILSFFIVQVVTTCSGMLSYPFDTVRRHMMMQSGETECQYKGTVDCFMKIYKSERGLMLSSVEHSPASFVEQEERKKNDKDEGASGNM
ncbi:hypothetical protein QYF61_021591 [Mycteria americana]|uniref:ADP/ATP translocase n=1 Tax=Mycteria americana TaxID=33587 RepID=A0AAN7N6I5_MYCAM|nr:hypothetical protein QYF61_021591 [Mycteria americana]